MQTSSPVRTKKSRTRRVADAAEETVAGRVERLHLGGEVRPVAALDQGAVGGAQCLVAGLERGDALVEAGLGGLRRGRHVELPH